MTYVLPKAKMLQMKIRAGFIGLERSCWQTEEHALSRIFVSVKAQGGESLTHPNHRKSLLASHHIVLKLQAHPQYNIWVYTAFEMAHWGEFGGSGSNPR